MRFFRFATVATIVLVFQLACRQQAPDLPEEAGTREPPETGTASAVVPVRADELAERDAWPLVVFLGDSLTAGMGVAEEDAFPSRLSALLEEAGEPIQIINAGISGDTTAGGLNRVDWILSRHPDLVVIELGANDGLRGLDPVDTEENLRSILRKVKATGARALLVGIYVPPNYGPDYSERFAALFPRLAEEEQVPLLPFLLEGVAGIPELNQMDGVHPNPEGHRRVAQHVFSSLFELLKEEATDG